MNYKKINVRFHPTYILDYCHPELVSGSYPRWFTDVAYFYYLYFTIKRQS